MSQKETVRSNIRDQPNANENEVDGLNLSPMLINGFGFNTTSISNFWNLVFVFKPNTNVKGRIVGSFLIDQVTFDAMYKQMDEILKAKREQTKLTYETPALPLKKT